MATSVWDIRSEADAGEARLQRLALLALLEDRSVNDPVANNPAGIIARDCFVTYRRARGVLEKLRRYGWVDEKGFATAAIERRR